jgi:MFS transporter, Spinster family, sphingosine-1-phosphate transporter
MKGEGAAPAPDGAAAKSRATRYGIYVIGVVAAAMFLSALDQTVLPAVAASIQAEFGISDAQIGALVSAFTISLALSTLPIGFWADRWTRRTILGLGLTVWSLATLATGLTRTFPQALTARAVLGIGEATALPTGNSLIGDYFTRRSRGRAMAAVVLAVGCGAAAGAILGGAIGLRFGWRWAFYLAAGPGLLMSLLAFTLREPLRGAAENQGPRLASACDSGLRAFGRLLQIRSYTAATCAAAFAGLAIGGIQFVPLYIHRAFGLNIAQAGALMGIPLLLGALIGSPVVGWIVDWRGRRSARAPVEVGLVGLLVGALAAALVFSARSLVLLEFAAIVFAIAGAAVQIAPFVILQNVVMPSLRASASSMANTITRLFGFALGPLVVGLVSDLAHRDLGLSLLILTPTALLAGAACMAQAMGSIRRDVAAMEQAWAIKETGGPSMHDPNDLEAKPAPAAMHL